MQLTVVVCTHNRSRLLKRLLDSLFSAQRPADTDIELLIVANACVDDTAAVLREWAKKAEPETGLRLLWTEEPVRGKSNALNLALDLLSGDAAVFIDDDHRVDTGFLTAIRDGLKIHSDFNILCGRILPDWDGREPGWIHDAGPYRIYPPPVPVFDAGDEPRELTDAGFKPGGGNLIIRVPLLSSLGRFSTELGPQGHDFGGGEDSEFLKRAMDTGERLFYTPQILQRHYVDLARLRLVHMMRLSYQRSLASARLHHANAGGVPPYLWRKLLRYLLAAVVSLNHTRRRFYLVRSAAALGEIKGISG